MHFHSFIKISILPLIAIVSVIATSAYAQDSTPLKENTQTEFSSNPDDLVAGRFEVGEELIFSLNLKRYKLGDLFAIASNKGLLFDFSAYMDIVEFPIVENVQERNYKGWFINRENTFWLDISDLSKPVLTLKGKTEALDPKQILFLDDLLYISENYLNEWFGISHDYKYESLEITLATSQPLPFEQELLRRGRSINGKANNKAIHPELFRGYEILSPQIFDLQLNGNYREATDNFSAAYGIIAARDVAQVHANLFLSGSDQKLLSNSRLNLSKVSLEKNLLGVLGASKVEFGDVRPVRQGFSRSESRGLRITNAGQTNELDLQLTNVVGNLQIGWDVELYRNGALIDQKFDVQNGQYEFLDVQLLFGENNFEVVKYGPQGQIEKESQSKVIDKSFFKNAGLMYTASLTESGESLLGTSNSTEEFDAGYNFSTEMRTSVMPNLLLGLGLQSDFGGDFEQSQYNISLNTILADKIALSGTFGANTFGTQTTGINLRTSLGQHSFSAGYINSSTGKSQSEVFTFTNSGSFKLFANRQITYNNDARFNENSALKLLNISNSFGFTAANFGLFHRLEYVDEENLLSQESYTDVRGSLTLQKGFDHVFNRLTATYGIAGKTGLQALSMATSWNISKQFNLKFDFDYQLENEVSIGSLLFGWRHNNFSLYARAGYSSLSSWDFGLNTSFSLSAQPLIYGDTYFTKRKIAQSGSLSVRVFIDENLNAKLDPDELVIPNVKVNLVQSSGRGITNDFGIATIVGIADQTLTDIVIDNETLPDPFLKPLIEGVSIRFRKGIADKLDFPVAFASEVEGLLFVNKDEDIMPVNRVKILLKNTRGEITHTVSSEYDGYFYFEGVLAGNYTLHVENHYLDDNDLKAPNSIDVQITSKSELIIVDDIILAPKDKYDGFMALVNTFPSTKSLEYYLLLNQKNLSEANIAFVKLPKGRKMHLTAGFYATKALATSACQEVLARHLKCEASPYQYIAN